jgi:hypothetical protein
MGHQPRPLLGQQLVEAHVGVGVPFEGGNHVAVPRRDGQLFHLHARLGQCKGRGGGEGGGGGKEEEGG